MKRISKGKGVYARVNGGGTVYDITYLWRGKKIWESHVKDSKGRSTLGVARRIKAKREREKGAVDFMPPHLEQKVQAKQDQQQEDARRPLLFEVAVERFLTEEIPAGRWVNPGEIKRVFENRLDRAFHGRHLDEITRRDVKTYYLDRVRGTGPFKDWPYTAGPRVPQVEIAMLSSLYRWLIDYEEYEIQNPCHRPKAGKGSPLRYVKEHKPVIPTEEQVRAICEAPPMDPYKRADSDPGKPIFRTFLKLLATTGARPSEICHLTYADVELPEPGKVRGIDGKPVLGRVTFRDTKTAGHAPEGESGDRTIPLHPWGEASLREIMDPDAKPETPIFKKRGSSESWESSSYKKRWKATLATAVRNHPELAGMWIHDFRPAAKTTMINSGIPRDAADRIQGHRPHDVSAGYYNLTPAMEEKAILTLGPIATAGDTAHIAYTAHVVTG